MSRKLRVFLTAFIVLSIAGLAVLVFLHYKQREASKVTFKEEEEVKVKIDRIRYSGTKDGRLEWELEADSARRSREEDLTIFENVKVTFYAKDGTPYTLTAPEGRLSEGKGEITVSGGAVVVSPKEGLTLKSDSLVYSIKKKELTTSALVDLTSERLDLRGTGLLVSIDSEEIRLSKGVKAVFKGRAA